MNFRKLPRLTARAAVLALAVLCARVQSAVELPATAITDDTYVVANMSMAKLDPASLEASAKVILGANIAMAQEGLTKYKAKYDDYVSTGAESVTIVMSGDPSQGKEPEPVVYIKMKAGSDHKALEDKIKAEQAKEGKPQETEISNDGDFMVMRKKGTALPTAGSADRAKSFMDLLGAGDRAFVLSFIPNDKVRAQMKEKLKADPSQPAWMQTLSPFMADSKSVVLEAKIGDAPNLGVSVTAADEASAKGISDAVVQGSQQLKEHAGQMKQAGPQFAGMADAFNSLADALKPAQSGSKVELSIDGKVVGPAVSNLLPLMMMGAGGGGPRPAQRNPGQ